MTAGIRQTHRGRRKRGWMNLRVEAIHKETHDTETFVLVDAEEGGRQFDYVAGQYLTFRFDGLQERPIVRSYTMSSSPCQPDFTAFTVKRVDGGLVSNWLCDEVKVGSVLRARGPIGRFCYEPDHDKQHLIMVAGGSGVTPFISIIREFQERMGQQGAPQKMTLLVSFRSQQDLICWSEIKAAARAGVQILVTLSREEVDGFWHGRIDDEMLTRLIGGEYSQATFMTCGPEAMMKTLVEHCRRSGVEDQHIKTESFES